MNVSHWLEERLAASERRATEPKPRDGNLAAFGFGVSFGVALTVIERLTDWRSVWVFLLSFAGVLLWFYARGGRFSTIQWWWWGIVASFAVTLYYVAP